MEGPRWERIQDIFCAALEVDPDARSRFLDGACGEDRDLRHEVENFLASLEEEDDLVAAAIGAEAASVLGPEAAPELNRVVGQYQLIRRIGHGGMGAVYLAQRADRQYERQVAIKLLRSETRANAELVRRFRTERQILAALDHPNIAHLLDGGLTESGTPYLVMEYVDGVSIDEYCRIHALSVHDRIRLFRMVCSAVHCAHQTLVVHRDIKPSNILVTAEGVPKLLDFGIAKLLRPEAMPHTVALTRPAERLMTMEYASPEQIRGDTVTTATDVYSLGIVLYELLAGRHPFEAQKSDSVTLARSVCETDPMRPSAAASGAAAGFASELRGDLDEIVLMAIRKDPGSRYSSAEQFSDDLVRFLSGFPVRASRGTRRYRASKFVQRHRFGVAAAAGFVLLLALFGVGMSVEAARVKRERDTARLQRARSDRVSAFLTALFGSADPYLRHGKNLSARDLLDIGSERIAKELPAEPEVRAELLETMAEAYQHLGAYDRSSDLFRQEIQALEQAYGGGAPTTARVLRQLADVERQRSLVPEAEAHLRQALAIHEKLPPGKDMELSHTLNNLALVLQLKGDMAQSEQYLRRAIVISRKYPDQFSETLTMMSNLAIVLVDEGRANEGEPLLREVVDQRRKVLGEKHPQVGTGMSRLARVLAAEGNYREAEPLYRQAVARERDLLGEQHLETLSTASNLANVLSDEGVFAEAETLYRQSIDTGSRVYGDKADMAGWYAGLAWLLFREGKTAEADRLFQRGLGICHALIGSGSVREAQVLEKYSVLEAALGRYDSAQSHIDAALAIYAQKLGFSQIPLADLLFQRAEIDWKLGRNREADNLFGQALGIDRSAGRSMQLQTAAHLLGYAEFLAGTGSAAQAEPLAHEAVEIRVRELPSGFWDIDSAKSVLGGVLVARGRYSEAEPLVLDAYRNLNRTPGAGARDSQAALQRVVRLYEAWGKPDRAQAYRAALRAPGGGGF